jgi:Cu/Zn superoxide dismutase
MNLKKLVFGCMVVSALSISVVAAQEATPDPLAPQLGATALLQDANGGDVGTVTFANRADGKVVIVAQIYNLVAGFHGLHIHSVGACEAPFDTAGAHLNLDGTTHPDHSGDLPSVLVGLDGMGELMTVTDRFTLEDLFDADGSAIIIHSSPDNFANIPERYGTPDEQTLTGGDSGDRVACGVIQQDEGMTAG